jgi:glycosyltransferase involved in cell wall biosynthesis
MRKRYIGAMKLLRIIGSADPTTGGPIEGIMRLNELLRRDGHLQEIATLDLADAPFLSTVDAVVHPLGARRSDRLGLGRLLPARYGYSPYMLPWLRRHVGDYDGVIVSGLWNYATMAARHALADANVPYVVFTHGMLDPWFRRRYPAKHLIKQCFWWMGEGVLLRDAAAVLFTSEEERAVSRNAFRPYHVRERVVAYGTASPPGPDSSAEAAFRASLPGLGDKPFILFLSRIHVKKGIDMLIDAFAAVAPQTTDLQLVIAGPANAATLSALQARAVACGVAARIHWPGMVRGSAKWAAFRACQAFVLPSHQENFGIAVVEAASIGALVLITDKVNIWREFAAADAGLIEPDTTAGITALLQRFIALGADARARMGDNGRDLFEQQFKIDVAARDLVSVLEEVARGYA